MHRTACLIFLALTVSALAQEPTRPRAREIGIAPGVFAPGPLNAITDVEGVRVGHFTLIEGDRVRTGATAIVPAPGNLFRHKVPAGRRAKSGKL